MPEYRVSKAAAADYLKSVYIHRISGVWQNVTTILMQFKIGLLTLQKTRYQHLQYVEMTLNTDVFSLS